MRQTSPRAQRLRAEANQIVQEATAKAAVAREAHDAAQAELERARAVAATLLAAAESIESGSDLPRDPMYATFERMATLNEAVAEDSDDERIVMRRGQPLISNGPVATAAREMGISAADVARKLGVNVTSARNWDHRGKIPNEQVRAKLDRILAAYRKAREKAK